MIPFPGASLPAQESWSSEGGGDPSLTDDVLRRGGRGGLPGHRVITPGTEWRSWAYTGDAQYLEEDDLDLDCSWVLEVLGGAGELAVSWGRDPGYLFETSGALANDGGTLTVTGPGTYLVPTDYTGAEVAAFDGGLFTLRIVSVSGSVDVQQIKLRAWPAGGPLGGWSEPQSTFETDPISPVARTAVVGFSGYGESTVLADAWAQAREAYHADVANRSGAASRQFIQGAGATPMTQQMAIVGNFGNYGARFESFAGQTILVGPNPADRYPISGELQERTDWIVPPNEVRLDPPALVQQLGAPEVRWGGQIDVQDIDDPNVPGRQTAAVTSGDFVSDVPGEHWYSFPVVTAPEAPVGTIPLPGPGRMLLLQTHHSIAQGAADEFPGGTSPGVFGYSRSDPGIVGVGLVRAYVQMPAYRVWDPAGAPDLLIDPPHRLIGRGDGLGMGSGRVFATGTRQSGGSLLGTF